MKTKNLLLSILVCCLFFCNIGRAKSASDEFLVLIGNRKINVREFELLLAQYRGSEDIHKVLSTLTLEGRASLLHELIDFKLMARHARKEGIDKDPSTMLEIGAAVDLILSQKVIAGEMKNIDLSEKSLLNYYNLHQSNFMTGKRVKSRHINTRSKEDANEAMSEIIGGKDFAHVASEWNIDATKPRGGDLGWVRRGIMVKPFEDVLFSLKINEISRIVETRFGFHIIKVEEIDEGKLKPFDSVKEEVKKRMIEQHISKLKQDLMKKYPVKINEELLEGM